MTSLIKLDSSIWSILPQDVIFLIIDMSSVDMQARWSYTCHLYYEYARRKLWTNLTVQAQDFRGYGHRLSYHRVTREMGRPRWGLIHYLAGEAVRRSKSNASFVRHLEVNITMDPMYPLEFRQGSNVFIESAMSKLMVLLPRLTSCIFRGAFYQRAVEMLERHLALETLSLRGNNCSSDDGRTIWDPSSDWPIEDWQNCQIDYRPLANLERLRHLKIGQLQLEEANWLSQVISEMDLQHLDLDTCPTAGYEEFGCVVTFFLRKLLSSDETLPQTLETLTLRSRQLTARPEFSHLLQDCCRDCSELRRIEVMMPEMYCLPGYLYHVGLDRSPIEKCDHMTYRLPAQVLRDMRGPCGNPLSGLRCTAVSQTSLDLAIPSPGTQWLSGVRDDKGCLDVGCPVHAAVANQRAASGNGAPRTGDDDPGDDSDIDSDYNSVDSDYDEDDDLPGPQVLVLRRTAENGF